MHRRVITIYVRSCNPTHISVEEKGRRGAEDHCFQTGRGVATECSHLDPENILVPVTLLRLSTTWLSVHDIYLDPFNGDQGAEQGEHSYKTKIQEYYLPAYILETKMIVHLDHISMRQRYLEGSK